MNKYKDGVLTIYDKNDNEIELYDETILFYYERATPKKVIPRFKTNNGVDEYIGADCPNCELFLIDEYSFCLDCGQALDWSK